MKLSYQDSSMILLRLNCMDGSCKSLDVARSDACDRYSAILGSINRVLKLN
jgi:hypothetical protein